ncbi:DUF2087 domain-containing protein [Aestuariimicrobium ganziense]|uniref:DUF2087 domain-containing protein n=1 Tax=Aestuariimicrobium ganziense TaxID=2773677 RepID=UPI0019453E43|nr:DUF2087 domain-containing protein [Aestuariimicrobium ganziense]
MTDLLTHHRAAQLVQVLANPTLTRLLGAMPTRPGQSVQVTDLLAKAGLDSRTGAPALARALELDLLETTDDGLVLNRTGIEQAANDLVASSPLVALVERHPDLAAFVRLGRFAGWPSDHDREDRVFAAIAELFIPGEQWDETELTAVIAQWHDDPALVRRGLADRGLLVRDPGSQVSTVPQAAGADR